METNMKSTTLFTSASTAPSTEITAAVSTPASTAPSTEATAAVSTGQCRVYTFLIRNFKSSTGTTAALSAGQYLFNEISRLHNSF